MRDSEEEALLFRDCGRNEAARRAAIDYAHVHHELHKSVTSMAQAVRELMDTASGHQLSFDEKRRRP